MVKEIMKRNITDRISMIISAEPIGSVLIPELEDIRDSLCTAIDKDHMFVSVGIPDNVLRYTIVEILKDYGISASNDPGRIITVWAQI